MPEQPLNPSIRFASTAEALTRCFPVMGQLRTHLTLEDFLHRVQRQMQHDGYKLVFLEFNGSVSVVAGYRILEMLSRGKFMYVDDLVTDAGARQKGYGRQMFDWLVEEAKKHGCERLHLDSGVQRAGAHAFYFRQGMVISAYHFAIDLT
jgi:GNAT superfamily N-acetyltransferase